MSKKGQAELPFTSDRTTTLRKGLSEDEWQQFEDIEEKQILFHAWLKHNKLTRDEEKAIACKTHENFVDFWAEFYKRAHEKFEARHKSGWSSWSRKYQSFAVGVREFMDDFQPLLDACKQMGKPYSGAAVGTITILFMVAANKSQMEEQVVSAMEGVKDRLPGFRILQKIYNDDTELEKDLRKKILLAYIAFIDMAMEITRYYFSECYRRWAIATFKSTKFKDIIDQVHERVLAVRLRCDELIHWNMSRMEERIKDQQQKLNKIRRGLENTHLISLQKILGISTWSSTQQLEELELYRQSIQREQHYEEGGYDQMKGENIERFRQEDVFTEWSQNGKSSMLLLTGIGNTNIALIQRHCWLSPFAIDMIDRLRNEEATHAFYIFWTPDRTSIYTALAIIVFQLLSSKVLELEDHQQELAANAHAFIQFIEDEQPDDEKKAAALTRLLTRAMKVFNREDTVHVVLDRLDMCKTLERNDLMRMMVEMINEASCSVKIVLVSKWMGGEWRLNERELKVKLRAPATLRQVSKTQEISWGY